MKFVVYTGILAFLFQVDTDSDGLSCPDGVTIVSNSLNSPDYYECKQVRKKAILKICPMGKIYHPWKQRCESVDLRANNFKSMKRSTLGHKRKKISHDLETFQTMVLGRIAHIGDLYDTKKDFYGFVCPDGVTRYSSGVNSPDYYECKQVGKKAIVKTCPMGKIYYPKKQRCELVDLPTNNFKSIKRSLLSQKNEKKSDDLETFETMVLGRIVHIGDLYDARKGEVLAGVSLWKDDTIRNNVQRSFFPSMRTHFFAAKTSFERLDNMNIEAELKLDFLGGLISVTGAAKFFREGDEREDMTSFNMAFQATTFAETLPAGTEKNYNSLCTGTKATHVVSSIIYGMNGYFNFKRSLRHNENKQKIIGSMQAVVKSIPSFSIEGKASADLEGMLKNISKEIEVTLYGDFLLQHQPTTFDEAIQTYKTLPSLLGTKPEYGGSSKIKMQLTPITTYCKKADVLLIGISDQLINQVTITLEKFECIRTKVSTLLASRPAIDFLPVQRNLDTFNRHLKNYESQFKSKLQEILPKIKGGGQGSSEQDLIKLLSDYIKSPYSKETSARFLGRRKREIQAMQFVLNLFGNSKASNIKVVDFESANDVQNLLSKTYVVVFKVNVLQPKTVTDSFINGVEVNETNFWFNSDEDVGALGQQVRLFRKFAEENRNFPKSAYLVKIAKVKQDPVHIYAQQYGITNTSNFVIPSRPPKLAASNRSYDSVTFLVTKPSNTWITKLEITYWCYILGESNDIHTTHYEDFGSIYVGELKPATIYQFRMRYITVMGYSPASKPSDPIVTTPCSEPANLRIDYVSSSSVKIRWNPPDYVGKGIIISDYKVAIEKSIRQGRKEEIVKSQVKSFEDLLPAESYIIEVVAMIPAEHFNTSFGKVSVSHQSFPASINVYTSPKSPSNLRISKVDLHSISITWVAPKIAKGSKVTEFLVKYVKLNNEGNSSITGTEKIRSAQKNCSFLITDLTMGTLYGISVAVSTSLGKSIYSQSLIVKTMYNKTELDKLRDDVKELNSSVADAVASLKSYMDIEKRKLENLKHQLSSYHRRQGLIGGTKDSEGNVFIGGKAVCDDSWDLKDAQVACRQFGFTNAVRATTESEYGNVPDNFIMDDVNCDGTENTLLDCDYNRYDDCSPTEGAGVVCSEPYSVSIKLIGGESEEQGNVYVDGKPVCDDGWNINAGQVACRQLGYSGVMEIKSESAFGQVPDIFAIDDINCNGNEARLLDCSRSSSTDDCGAGEGAGVICY